MSCQSIDRWLLSLKFKFPGCELPDKRSVRFGGKIYAIPDAFIQHRNQSPLRRSGYLQPTVIFETGVHQDDVDLIWRIDMWLGKNKALPKDEVVSSSRDSNPSLNVVVWTTNGVSEKFSSLKLDPRCHSHNSG